MALSGLRGPLGNTESYWHFPPSSDHLPELPRRKQPEYANPNPLGELWRRYGGSLTNPLGLIIRPFVLGSGYRDYLSGACYFRCIRGAKWSGNLHLNIG